MRSNRNGFTLLEIMIVISLVAIAFSAGVPLMFRALAKDNLARAMNDTIEGCKTARDRAILQGVAYQFIIKEDGVMNVSPAPHRARTATPLSAADSGAPAQPDNSGSPYASYPRNLGEGVAVQLVAVNFVELMQEPEARVTFYPNGTSDEFAIVYMWEGKQRTVKLDVVTGTPYEYFNE